mmetsp:Transcript_4312/g.9637  ORF Transcript_4312/g.9637 Transcript_4312/m.9637 type:complete len:121 (+) Transcript_4312:50-412(+)
MQPSYPTPSHVTDAKLQPCCQVIKRTTSLQLPQCCSIDASNPYDTLFSIAFSNLANASSISSFFTINGGTNLTTLGPAATNSNPSFMASPTNSAAVHPASSLIATPLSNPHPRTSPSTDG